MNIIIVGCGRMGSNLANQLSNTGHDVCIIDRDKDRLSVLGSGFNGHIINGIEFDRENLNEAEIEHADALLAVTPDDNINITVAMIANSIYCVPIVIARANDPKRRYIYESFDIRTISPVKVGVDLLISKINAQSFNILNNLADSYQIIELVIEHDIEPTYIDKIEQKFHCIISAIMRDERTILPRKDAQITKGDKIICTIEKTNSEKLLKYFTKEMSIWIP